MARIRTIKPETSQSASLTRCSIEAELMFIKSWCFFDDDGVHAADPLQLKMQVYPGRDFSEQQIAGWVAELIAEDCLAEFEVPSSDDPVIKHYAGRKFWICVNWHHQKIQHPTPTQAPIRALWRKAHGESDPSKFGYAPQENAPTSAAPPASDDAALWEQVFRRANQAFRDFNMGDTRKPQDRNLALKVCYLVLSGRLREEWLVDAVKAMKKSQAKATTEGKQFKPGALLTQIFKNKCSESKPPLDFRRFLAECPEPPDKEAPPAAPPSPPPASSPAPVAVDLAALAGAAVKAPPAPDKKPAQSGAEFARQLRQLEAEARREAQQKKSA